MKTFIVALGSVGDLHPLLGIGTALQKRGHSVTVLANSFYEENIAQSGLRFHSIDAAIYYEKALNEVNRSKIRTLVIENLFLRPIKPVYEYCGGNYTKGETVAICSINALGVRLANEKFGLPMVSINVMPMMFISADKPARLIARKIPDWFPKWFYQASNRFVEYLFDREICEPLNTFRAEIGLKPQTRILRWMQSPDKVIGLFPDWFAPPQPDWIPQAELTGFPLFDEGQLQHTMPADSEEFLNAGSPPIIFTPGTAIKNAEAFFKTGMQATLNLGARAIFLTKYKEQIPFPLPPTIRYYEYIPFSTLFPRAAAVVHYGGIGTLAQALVAGKPQLIAPYVSDQFDNASKVTTLGIGDEISLNKFAVDTLAAKLKALVDNPTIRETCDYYATKIKVSDTLNDTCRAIERTVQNAQKAGR